MIYLNTKSIKKSLPTLNKIASALKSIRSIRITANGDTLTMSAADLDIAAQCSFNAPMGAAEFDVLVNAKQFCRIVRSIKSGTIGFAVDDDLLVIHHKRSHIHFPTQNAADFPDFPQAELHLGDISADLSMIAKSIGDSTDASLCQVAIEQDGTIAATNGYVVGIIKTDDFLSESAFLDGAAARKIANQLNGNISIDNAESMYVLTCNNWTFWIPRASGKFPNYRGIIPQSFAHTMREIGVHELLYHILAASEVSDFEVELSINGGIKISAKSFNGIKWESKIDDVAGDSEISICVDPICLIDALTQIRKINATATLGINGDMKPMSLSSGCGTYQSVIMPLLPQRERTCGALQK